MHPMVARAFLSSLLDDAQRERLRKYEREKLPTNRYLQGFEICRMFSIKPKALPEEDTDKMEILWKAFERNFLWPQQRRDDALHPTGCTMFSCRHPPTPGVHSKLDEIYQWEDFARINFGSNVEEIAWA